jgi:hypothetical protein
MPNLKYILFVFLLFYLFNKSKCFDAGWTNSKTSRNHFQMTQCALYRVTYDYLKSVHDLEDVEFPVLADNPDFKCSQSEIKDFIREIIEDLNMDYEQYAKVIDLICDMNRIVDLTEAYNSDAHFDDESFKGGAERLKTFILTAKKSCDQGEYDMARIYFAKMLHGLQDFYSHSNHVEFEPKKTNVLLGKSVILGTLAENSTRTCHDCTTEKCKSVIFDEIIKNRILTSGYFSKNKPIGKCR